MVVEEEAPDPPAYGENPETEDAPLIDMLPEGGGEEEVSDFDLKDPPTPTPTPWLLLIEAIIPPPPALACMR